MMEHPEAMEVRPVSEMVEHDPAVVARLLQTVNSAFYGLQRAVTTPERAVVLLGPMAVVGLVAGMGMQRLRPLMSGPAASCAGRLIGHSVATGYLTRHILEHTPGHVARSRFPKLVRSGAAFTAGLLHDLGKLILTYNFPEEAAGHYERRALADFIDGDDPLEMERLVFGCDHTEAGIFAALKLGFPDLLNDVVRLHHDDGALRGNGVSTETACVLRAVRAASLLARTFGFGIGSPVLKSDCTADPIWPLLAARDFPVIDDGVMLLDVLWEERDATARYVAAVTAPDLRLV